MKKSLMDILGDIRKVFIGFFGLFNETSPNSMMRFMSFCMFFFAGYETNWIIKKSGLAEPNNLWLIVILFAFAFFPKVMQKAIENKYGSKDTDVCVDCNGTGIDSKGEKCPTCNGSGNK